MTNTLWFLVANAARARLFATDDDAELVARSVWYNADARHPSAPADRLPRTHESATAVRHAIEPRLTPRARAQQRFAHEIAVMLTQAAKARAYDRLVLAAPPRFLGQLHAELPAVVRTRVVLEIHHNIVPESVARLRARLPAELLAPARRIVA